VFIIKRVKLYYTGSGMITLYRWPSGAQVERGRTATYLVINQIDAQNLVS